MRLSSSQITKFQVEIYNYIRSYITYYIIYLNKID